ncbi:hypothetical protein P7K49_018800 [Saguinus oedipus]|uniref:Ig-like domain-containing protein n=1 Tax=Saguinus oedipus TaxID=9490 RepID=A0ABQ9V6D6_SAGOE|nr:hypothetical protein P7K49_018800 [Saguinus oedipus]
MGSGDSATKRAECIGGQPWSPITPHGLVCWWSHFPCAASERTARCSHPDHGAASCTSTSHKLGAARLGLPALGPGGHPVKGDPSWETQLTQTQTGLWHDPIDSDLQARCSCSQGYLTPQTETHREPADSCREQSGAAGSRVGLQGAERGCREQSGAAGSQPAAAENLLPPGSHSTESPGSVKGPHLLRGERAAALGWTKSRTGHAQGAFAHRSDLLPRLPAAAQAPVKISLNLLASSAPPEVASWLLCKVSGFSPPDVLLTWLWDQHEVSPSWFATAHPAPQPRSTAFQAWSVLRVPAPPSPQPATYMCKVHHKASQTLLNASLSLDVSCESPPGPGLGGGLCGVHKELESTLGKGGAGQGCPGHTGPFLVSGRSEGFPVLPGHRCPCAHPHCPHRVLAQAGRHS